MKHYIYIVECGDKTLYTGYTNDLEKRIVAHNTSETGARYTRSRRPVILRYFETFKTKSRAMKREFEIKQIKRKDKLNLIAGKNYFFTSGKSIPK